MSPRPQPIVALDVPSLARGARARRRRSGARADFYKVGLQLFTAEGPAVVAWLQAAGQATSSSTSSCTTFPRPCARRPQAPRRMGAALLTVHGLGGDAMLRAAVEGAGERTGVLVVTVLTSMDLRGGERGRWAVALDAAATRCSASRRWRPRPARTAWCARAPRRRRCARRFGDAAATLVPGMRTAPAGRRRPGARGDAGGGGGGRGAPTWWSAGGHGGAAIRRRPRGECSPDWPEPGSVLAACADSARGTGSTTRSRTRRYAPLCQVRSP